MSADNIFATRFWSKVDQSAGPDACWPWKGRVKHDGYGLLDCYRETETGRVRTTTPANRVAFALATGIEPAPGLHVRHTCRNPVCCNPAHLVLGTQTENEADKRKWRGLPWTWTSNAKNSGCTKQSA